MHQEFDWFSVGFLSLSGPKFRPQQEYFFIFKYHILLCFAFYSTKFLQVSTWNFKSNCFESEDTNWWIAMQSKNVIVLIRWREIYPRRENEYEFFLHSYILGLSGILYTYLFAPFIIIPKAPLTCNVVVLRYHIYGELKWASYKFPAWRMKT